MRLCSPALDATKLCTALHPSGRGSWTRNPQFVAWKAGTCHQPPHFLSSLFDFCCVHRRLDKAQQFLQSSVSVLLFRSIPTIMVISCNASSWANGIECACSPSFWMSELEAELMYVCSLERVQQRRIYCWGRHACCLPAAFGRSIMNWISFSCWAVHYWWRCALLFGTHELGKMQQCCTGIIMHKFGNHGMLMLQGLGTWDYACMAAASGFRHLPHRGSVNSFIIL